MLSFVCVYNNRQILDEYLKKSLDKQKSQDYELILVDNRENKYESAATALNTGAGEAEGDHIVFLHQDINLTDTGWVQKTQEILKKLDNPGIIGVAGKTTDSLVRGNIKHGTDPVDLTEFKITKPEEASTVDECLFIIPKTVYDKHPLDEKTCAGWHLYAVDYVYNIKNKNYRAYLIPSTLEHRSKGDSMSREYYDTLKILQKKYREKKLIRTCMGDWFTFIPTGIQRFVKRFKNY